MTLYDVIRRFLTVWFPDDFLTTYDGEITTVVTFVTVGLVLFIAYNLCIGWWWRRR